MKKITKIFILLFAASLLIFLWSFFIEPNIIKIEDIVLGFDDLPEGMENIKIAHISDIHSKKCGRREEKILQKLKETGADFIFITGDIVDWSDKDFASCLWFWKGISASFPNKVFGVYGNHDHKNSGFKKLKTFLQESGIIILTNESGRIFTSAEDYFFLIGVDDPHLGFDKIEEAMIDVEENSFKILLAHSPEILRKMGSQKTELVLVGHTHGGQIDIPFLIDFFLPLKYDKQYKKGLFEQGLGYMYVNRGIGTTFLPLRLNSFPEIALITFIER